ncbi:MAG: hypothetical protein CMK74_11685 [Pseudomonadales bacterium]|nr:hypothetical protein [Pseudomonadales bacterium]|tara:strand:- start:7145 stop:8296 length:1152 start_codon:yes stop_codon:yes gene_type:complete
MNIEILGVDPRNKGAALMLEAIKAQVLKFEPNANFCVRLSFDSKERLRYGLWGMLPRDSLKKRIFSSVIERILPSSFFTKFGLVRDQDISLVLDSSGFAYGDFWGVEKLNKRLGRNVERWKSQNKKVVLLPQAWGAFEKEGFKPTLKKISTNVDLMFARDKQSLSYILEQVGDKGDNIEQAPDFTCTLKPPVVERLSVYEGVSFVIPNEKVIKSFGQNSRELYIKYMSLCCTKLLESGHKVVILNHEGLRDEKLAKDITATINSATSEIETLSIDDPLETKYVLSRAKCIVSSRFHGLVSALSSGVPSLAVGWSHKYEELLNDYDCSEFVVDFINEEEALQKLSSFIDATDSSTFNEQLTICAGKQRRATELMWNKVFATVSK